MTERLRQDLQEMGTEVVRFALAYGIQRRAIGRVEIEFLEGGSGCAEADSGNRSLLVNLLP